MKEVTMKLYTFSELSEDVQKSIVEKERFNVMGEAMECYSSDWEGSLKNSRNLRVPSCEDGRWTIADAMQVECVSMMTARC